MNAGLPSIWTLTPPRAVGMYPFAVAELPIVFVVEEKFVPKMAIHPPALTPGVPPAAFTTPAAEITGTDATNGAGAATIRNPAELYPPEPAALVSVR